MEQAYAAALMETIRRGTRHSEAVAAMRRTLEASGRGKLMPRIAKAFERIAIRESRRDRMLLSVARETDASHAKREAHAYVRERGVQAEEIVVAVDRTLVGGWRLEGRGLLVDRSWKSDLLSIYNRATQ